MDTSKSSLKKAEKYRKIHDFESSRCPVTSHLVSGCVSNLTYVLKCFSISHLSPILQKSALKEASIMKMLHHPNIVQVKETYVTKKSKLCVVMEHADG